MSDQAPAYPKRLIEVDLPIARISAQARREKSIRHGHISTLHLWWARRPLAACRAVVCAALWPDPNDSLCPPRFRQDAYRFLTELKKRVMAGGLSPDQRAASLCVPNITEPANEHDHLGLRRALLDFIAEFANWDVSTNRFFLETSRALTQSAHESLGGEVGARPLVVDPFAGGGSIPLEALRTGCDVYASDLNPIPVLLNSVVLDYIPRYGKRLADEVRKWGDWVKREAERALAEFYPENGEGTNTIAYLWARTIVSEAPSEDTDPVEVPLISSMWLSKKPHRGRALRWVRDSGGAVKYEVVEKQFQNGRKLVVRQPLLEVFEPQRPSEVEPGTVKRGSATCPITGFTTPVGQVRTQLQQRRGGTRDARLLAVVTTRPTEKGRFYRSPTTSDFAAVKAAESKLSQLDTSSDDLSPIPHEEISLNEIRRVSIPIYGMTTWGDAFSGRQLLALITICRLVRKAGEACRHANNGDEAFSQVVQTLLALNVGKAADYGSALATWASPASKETVRSTFARQAISMVWDYAEASPFAASSGGWTHNLYFTDLLIAAIADSELPRAQVEQASATSHPLPDDSAQALVTDPPYYDSVPYSHLSDFFYVWLRRSLPANLASLFATESAPKALEIVVDRPHQLSTSKKDVAFYERELKHAFFDARRVLAPNGIGTIVFASKTTASWEAILQAVVDAGWIITGSWPIDTEREGRMAAIGQARLASSVHLVCRPRENADGSVRLDQVGDWRDVLQALPTRLHEWMPRLALEGVVGADAIFACLGPALEIFSRYSRVEKSNGDVVPLREYLEHVWAAVSNEALSMIFKDADAAGLEPDARLTAMWLWTLSTASSEGDDSEPEEDEEAGDDEEEGTKPAKVAGFVLEFDAARKIAQGLGIHLERTPSVVEVKGDKARLLPVAERTKFLFGKDSAEPATATKKPKKKDTQLSLFAALQEADATEGVEKPELKAPQPGTTVLDRVHQAMILFAAGRGEALKRFLVEEGIGKDARFWKLAQSLSALYPAAIDEKRWVDGVLARKKSLGL